MTNHTATPATTVRLSSRRSLGSTTDLDTRLQQHRAGNGARLLQVVTQAGITWQLARTWHGGRDLERQLKRQKNSPRLCPLCQHKGEEQ